MPVFFIDYWYIVLVIPAIIVALVAQIKVKTTYAKYKKVPTYNGISGRDAARRMLDENGLNHVQINCISGELTRDKDMSESRLIEKMV